jgi:hypothetical protein
VPVSTPSTEPGRKSIGSDQTSIDLTTTDDTPDVDSLLAFPEELPDPNPRPKGRPRGGTGPVMDIRDDCLRVTRRARDAFSAAISSGKDVDAADALLASATDFITLLWDFAKYRDQPFRDLLSAVEVATKRRTMDSFTDSQKNAILGALTDLTRWHLDAETADLHINELTDAGIDFMAPVTHLDHKKIRITITIED